ncbi:MAG: hypothetical protein BA865_07155 [Desulfobacterales bacterium S5133MH4]|nr:MAG: hypothetical protein BA865_07155 [Desulfobacterales bacterium S5133MH4]
MRIFDCTRLKRCLTILGVAMGAMGAVFCSAALSQNQQCGSDCLSCHEQVYQKGRSNFYMHPPFDKGDCGKCHLRQSPGESRSDSFSKEIAEPVVFSHPEYLAERTILIRGLNHRAAYDINVIFQDLSRNKVRKQFRGVVPATAAVMKSDDKRPPNISQVKIGPIVKGIFLETIIVWRTDKPSTSCVEYGLSDRYGKRTPEDNVWVRHHRVNIYELKKGKDYHFRVRSRDIPGNEAVSEDFVFNTGKTSPARGIEKEWTGKTKDRGLAVRKAQTFLLKSGLGLYLETTRPASVTVEYLKVAEPAATEEPHLQGAVAVKDSLAGLRTGQELTIHTCYQCHPPEVLGVSHPVGVRPRRTTKIPDDLPTLEGGIITCVTCHEPHGGSRRYFGRKDLSKDVCISCHEGY